MNRILVVDDDNTKRQSIVRVIKESDCGGFLMVSEAASSSEAAALLKVHEFLLLIIDINLPVLSGTAPAKDGGIRFLRQLLKSGGTLKRPHHIIGLTAYEDLEAQFGAEFTEENWQLLRFDSSSSLWSDKLTNLLTHILATISPKCSFQFESDLAVITALKPVELEAVLALPAEWKEQTYIGDDTTYYAGKFSRNSKEISVVAAGAIEMGAVAAACLTMKIIRNARPKFVAMTGIAAGLVGSFGDVLVADQSWDYCSGKIVDEDSKGIKLKRSHFSPAPSYISIDPALKEKLQLFGTQRKAILNSIRDSWQGPLPNSALQLHVGAIATGAAVIESALVIRELLEKNRKVVGLDMETYGVYLACRLATEPRPKCFSAKSVCDFGVPPKTDSYQKYAAYTSARFIYEFALDQLGAESKDV